MRLHSVLIGIDLIAAAIVVYFFLWGLSDGTVTTSIGDWLLLIAGMAAIIGGGVALGRAGYVKTGNALLLVLAAPTAAAALVLLILIIVQPEFRH